MTHPPELYIGLMSGTSVDGIDAALVEFTSINQVKVLETQFTPFDARLRESINKLAQTNWPEDKRSLSQNQDFELDTILADNYSAASLSLLDKAKLTKEKITAIANHGQTIRHEPNANPPFSLQLGDGQLIANKTRIKTITQFRQADLAVRGQGAPLMPAFHQALFSSECSDKNIFVLNIGGIANISALGDKVIGFDTGPGNTLLDQWIFKHKQCKYDSNGEWARSGSEITELLQCLLNDKYFSLPYPKSTGPDYFNLEWLMQRCVESSIDLNQITPQDVQYTLTCLTSKSIAQSIYQASNNSKETVIYICGGGAHNSFMCEQLEIELPNAKISTTQTVGIPADWVEAVGFAWLGYCCQHGITSNLPSVTGAKQSVVLGEVFVPS